jgi:hypothetical protein
MRSHSRELRIEAIADADQLRGGLQSGVILATALLSLVACSIEAVGFKRERREVQ